MKKSSEDVGRKDIDGDGTCEKNGAKVEPIAIGCSNDSVCHNIAAVSVENVKFSGTYTTVKLEVRVEVRKVWYILIRRLPADSNLTDPHC